MSYQRQTGQTHPALRDAPPLPDGCEQLWADFLHLHRRRGGNGFGPSPITDEQIDAWQRINRVALPSWQIDAIYRADDAYIAHHASRNRL